MSSGPVLAAAAALRAAYTELAALPVDALTHPELLTVLDGLKSLNRQLPTQSHRIIARLAAEADPAVDDLEGRGHPPTSRCRTAGPAHEFHR
jgi:hypothetical protein